MSTQIDFLLWVKGPGFDLALAVLCHRCGGALFGDLSPLEENRTLPNRVAVSFGPGMRTVFSRSLPDPGSFRRSPFTVIGGYAWHIGFLICLLFFVPHIELIKSVFGLKWPGLPNHLG